MKKRTDNNAIVLLFFASSIVMLFVAIYSGNLMRASSSMIEASMEERLLLLSTVAADLVAAEELEAFQTVEDIDTPDYTAMRERLHIFSEKHNLLYTYYIREQDGMYQFIIDSDYDTETQVGLQSPPMEYEEAPMAAFAGTPTSSGLGNYSSNWDGIFSAYAPVYDAQGVAVAIAGVDIADDYVITSYNNTMILAFILLLSLLIVIVTGSLGVFLYRRKALLSESANVAKSQFLSRMSHEIRTPMNAIIGLCRMAQDTKDPDKMRQHLDDISISSKHLLKLINDILDLSKIESGKIVFDLTPVRVLDELHSIEQLIAPQIEAKAQNFTVDLDKAIPTHVYCDSTRLRQIIVNLLANAVKFTPEHGDIQLSAKLLEKTDKACHVQWDVKDNGIGIEAKHLAKLFAPFEQGDGSTTRKYGGSGLGLSIVKQFVEMMDGEVRVESTLGVGSTFTFDLWLDIAATDINLPAPDEADKPEQAPLNLDGISVLLAEDVEINQIIAEDALAGFGANVVIAANGREAVDMYLEQPGSYRLIFMDIQMPIMDGYEATRVIRGSSPDGAASVPIIGMSANVFREDIELAEQAGMNDYIGKPFELDQLENAIRRALNMT